MRVRAKQFGLIVAYLLVCATALSRVVEVIFDPPRRAYLRTVDQTRNPSKVLSDVPLPFTEWKEPLADRLVEWVLPVPLEVCAAVMRGPPTIFFHPGDVLKEGWSDRLERGSGPLEGYWEQSWRVDHSSFVWQLTITAACATLGLIAATLVLRKMLRATNQTRGFEVKMTLKRP
jgi:hypothetical protein